MLNKIMLNESGFGPVFVAGGSVRSHENPGFVICPANLSIQMGEIRRSDLSDKSYSEDVLPSGPWIHPEGQKICYLLFVHPHLCLVEQITGNKSGE